MKVQSQIGWSRKAKLLAQINNQLIRLTQVIGSNTVTVTTTTH